MPTIFLKPRSPEFDQSNPEPQTKICDMPGCSGAGAHKAPKNRNLKEYYYFCQEHAREYNSAWDYFSGMPSHEVEDHIVSSLYGDRPTRRYDMAGMAEALRRMAWKTYHFADKESPRAKIFEENHNTPEFEALAVMGLEPPVTLDDIKLRYKMLAKKHHPDLNRGCAQSEELLKSVNMAYTILKIAYGQFEKLPERK